ncbi:hypothetical protein HT031_001564 [Scenedesmus sp. PABB004]|nr:hypothetical protein HT031_001564 [Scenedesmus sp. PABB004]
MGGPGAGPALGAAAGPAGPVRLHDLAPDALFHVLLHLAQPDVAALKVASARLRANTLAACQHWAPKVEAWLAGEPAGAALLRRLRQRDPAAAAAPAAAAVAAAPSDADEPAMCGGSAAAPPQQAREAGEASAAAGEAGGSDPPDAAADRLPAAAPQRREAARSAEQAGACRPERAAPAPGGAEPPPEQQLVAAAPHKPLDWRQVWTCIERAQTGPWQLDVRALAPGAGCPHGVLLTFELLLQQPVPPGEPGGGEAGHTATVGWRDSVTVLSFVLDRKAVDIVVDASGRVTSPQRDWCQGVIQLHPGQPRLLALEVSYIFQVPAWFLHPCTLAAPRPGADGGGCGGAGGGGCGGGTAGGGAGSCGGGSCASSVSGMALDGSWDAHSCASTSGLSSISTSAALCSAGTASDSASLTSSLTSSGSLATMASSAAGCGGGAGCGSGCGGGQPRLSLDLSVGFGSYVIDPRYIDEAGPSLQDRGLERLELTSRATWRASKVQSWLGRLLPGIRGHASSHAGGGPPPGGAPGGGGAPPAGAAPGGCGHGGKPGARPSFAVTLSKAAAWQVPSDTDRRFAEGFMFWAVHHKLEQLLRQHGLL